MPIVCCPYCGVAPKLAQFKHGLGRVELRSPLNGLADDRHSPQNYRNLIPVVGGNKVRVPVADPKHNCIYLTYFIPRDSINDINIYFYHNKYNSRII